MSFLDSLEILGPAFAAGLLIAFVHAPLGIEVLRRGIIFIDLAVAQAAGLGVVVVSIFWPDPSWLAVQAGALACALLTAALFHWVEARLPDQQEAIIGCTFVVTATLALLLLADRPHGGEEIQHLLSGQILFVTWHDVLIFLPVYAAVVFLWFRFEAVQRGRWFYLAFALAITSSVQLAGVYIVFASLILPALAVFGRKSMRLPIAWACGMASVILGVGLSLPFDLPTGPMLVMAYVVITIVARLRTFLAPPRYRPHSPSKP